MDWTNYSDDVLRANLLAARAEPAGSPWSDLARRVVASAEEELTRRLNEKWRRDADARQARKAA